MKKIVILLLFCYWVLPAGFGQQKDEGRDLYQIEIDNVRSDEGKIHVLMYDSADGFPEDENKAFRVKTVDAHENRVTVKFDHVPPGTYAFTILHDENGNGKMDKNFLGIPKEGYAFSNNYNPKSNKASFKDAQYEVKPGEKKVTVSLNYYL